MNLTSRVLNFIRKEGLVKPGSLLVLGVSGGADSVFLAHCLHRLRHELSVRLHIAHFNHRLRKSSDRDQKFVEDLARHLNVPITVANRRGHLGFPKLSEDAARRKRFAFFAKVAAATGAEAVVLAHTANDLAETVVMRLLRGTGLYGLRGILAQRRMGDVTFIRPLIGVTRSSIESYLRKHKLDHCVDETNARPVYLRNKVRLELMPYLSRLNPRIHSVLVDMAHTALDDYDYLEAQARQRLKESVVSSSQRVKIRIKNFTASHPSLRRLLLRLAFERLAGDTRQLTRAHVLGVEDMVKGGPCGAEVHWPRSVVVTRTRDFIEIHL
ncbi:MAG: tRNA lysidine(34) synthetase TilS [Candidatus Omnitrophica bacterium]|nr:tRNA lysidine(34) synthetase TilS [Candidatus Omnitrophota bacterium]